MDHTSPTLALSVKDEVLILALIDDVIEESGLARAETLLWKEAKPLLGERLGRVRMSPKVSLESGDPRENEQFNDTIERILEAFADRLVSTPLAELREMAHLDLYNNSSNNIFSEIWDKYHLLPSGSMLRRYSAERNLEVSPVAAMMDEIWP